MNKKILPAVIAIFISINSAQAIQDKQLENNKLDEVVLEEVLEKEAQENTQAVSINDENREKTLKEKLQDVYHVDVTKYDTPNFLLKEILREEKEKGTVQ